MIDPTNLFAEEKLVRFGAAVRGIRLARQGYCSGACEAARFWRSSHYSAWWPHFLGEPYKKVHENLAKILQHRSVEEVSAMIERWNQYLAFFAMYASALPESGYRGPMIIHGVDEADVPSWVTMLRSRADCTRYSRTNQRPWTRVLTLELIRCPC